MVLSSFKLKIVVKVDDRFKPRPHGCETVTLPTMMLVYLLSGI